MSETNAPSTSVAVRTAEEPKPQTVKASGSDKTRLVYRSQTGMFSKKPKAPSPAQVQKATAAKLMETTPDKPKSDWEEMIESQAAIAKRTDPENIGTAGTKAAEFLMKAAGLSVKNEEQLPPITVIIAPMELMHPEVVSEESLRPAVPKQPSFADAPFIDGVVVSTDAPTDPQS